MLASIHPAGYAEAGSVDNYGDDEALLGLIEPNIATLQLCFAAVLHAAGYAEAGSVDDSDDDDEATLDLTELPTRALAARAKPMTQQLGAHLAHLSQAGCGQQVGLVGVLLHEGNSGLVGGHATGRRAGITSKLCLTQPLMLGITWPVMGTARRCCCCCCCTCCHGCCWQVTPLKAAVLLSTLHHPFARQRRSCLQHSAFNNSAAAAVSAAAAGLQVNPLKLLSKAPRGSTAKAFHGIRASSKLVYADQVQVRCWTHACTTGKICKDSKLLWL
jgi:hypothetical protein